MRRGRIVAIAGLAAGLGGCIVDTPPERPASENLRSPMRTLQLGNGMRVVLAVAPDFGASVVAAGVGAGAADDPAGKRGLAHFVEHLTTQSSHNGVSFWSAVMEDRANARTTWDETVFHAMTDAGALDQTVAIAYDAVVDPLGGVDDATFQRQKRIVESEVRFHHVEETPADEALWAASFSPEHPYALPIAGTVESVDRLSWEDVTAFTAEHYRPARAVLVVVAPLPLDDQQRMIERVTGESARTAAVPETPSLGTERPPVDRSRSYTETSGTVATPHLLIGWTLPNAPRSGDVGSLVARTLLGLTFDLHQQDPDLSSVAGYLSSGTRADLLTLRVILKDGTHPERSARAVIDEVQKGLGKLGFEFDGFENLRAFFGSEAVYEQEDLTNQAIDAAWSTLRTGVPTFLARRGERMLSLGVDEVLGYVRTFLSPERAHVVLIRPGEPPAPPAGAGPQLAAASLRAPPAPASPSAKAAAVPSAAPPTPHPLLHGLETHVLSNGLTVVLFQRPGSAFHTVLLGFRGGHAQASPPGVIVATSWARRWFNQSPRLFGIVHDHWSNDNETLEELRGLGSNVGLTLRYLREQLGFSVFWPPKNFTDRVKVFQRESEMPAEVLARQMGRAMFADQPLGRLPTGEEIQRITPADVNRWVSHLRQPSNGLLAIVGDFDPEAALAAAEEQLGSWGRNVTPSPPPADPPPRVELGEAGQGERIFYAHQPGAAHATLRFDCLLPPTTPENWAAHWVFENGIYDAVYGELRERMGSTYAVWAHTLFLRGGTSRFELSTDIDDRLMPEALRWIRTNIAGPGQGFVGRARLETIKALAVRRAEIDGDTSTAWARYLVGNWTRGWPLDLHDRIPEAVARVTAEEVDQIADHCRANGVLGLLGDEPRLRRAWEQATR